MFNIEPVHEENSEVEIEVPPEVEVDGQKTKNSNVDQNVVKLDVSDELQERERLLQLEHERIENLNESLMAVKEQLATSRETNKQIISDLEREKLERSKLQNQLELLKNSNQTYSRERSSILAQDTENT